MTHAVTPGLIVATVSAYLYIALGVWVLTLTPRRLQTTLLGVFAVLFGLRWAPVDTLRIFDVIGGGVTFAHSAIQGPFVVLASVAALGLAWAVPRRLDDRRLLVVSLVTGFAFSATLAASFFAFFDAFGPTALAINAVGDLLLGRGSLFAAAVLLALRARPSPGNDPRDVTQLAVLALAFAMISAFEGGGFLTAAAGALGRGDLILAGGNLLFPMFWLLVAGLWGWHMVRAGDETVGLYRGAMLGILALLLVGAVAQVIPELTSSLFRGVVRTLGVALLAYGILRHDLAGLDAKVEWTVSKTTVAGVFVAVFFVVSEGAQVLFSGFANNEILGVIAAGALLFALSPIQRAADRIAEEVVPREAPGGAPDEESYRRAVEVALADGEITDDEERHLAELADELGISSARAYEIRREVEDATGEGEGS